LKIVCICLWVCLAMLPGSVVAEEKTQPEAPLQNGDFVDARAGYTFKVPEGFRRLTEEEHRETVKGVGEYFGKQAAERVLKQAPTYFVGAPDPARPKAKPPAFSITYYESDMTFSQDGLDGYRKELEDNFKKSDTKYGDLSVKLVDLAGIKALRMNYDLFNMMDNTRELITRIAIPGQGRLYEIYFVNSAAQTAEMEKVIHTVLNTFRMQTPVNAGDSASEGWWRRTLAYTLGGFGIGIVLSLIILAISRMGAKKEETQPG
jgi:hypothetical protein